MIGLFFSLFDFSSIKKIIATPQYCLLTRINSFVAVIGTNHENTLQWCCPWGSPLT